MLLHFGERYYERIWGGSMLHALYGKHVPFGKRIGEAWLISDHPGDESVVDEGPMAGRTLHEILESDPEAVLGSRARLTIHGRFPLLLKLLDSAEYLSVQVHPDDETAKRLNEPDVGKTEMWHVLHADPGSKLICGLDASVTPDRFAQAIQDGSVERLMTQFEVGEGTSVFVAAGIVHAIGGGIVLAEIQQNSDLTYRIYDWGRVQADGKPRELHVEKACSAVHFGSPHGGAAVPLSHTLHSAEVSVLAACRHFAAERVEMDGIYYRDTRGESFHIALAVSGDLVLAANGDERALKPGDAVLAGGGLDRFAVSGTGAFLEYYVPDLARDIVAPLQDAGHALESIIRLGGDPAFSDIRPHT